jgi:hypothetical protein
LHLHRRAARAAAQGLLNADVRAAPVRGLLPGRLRSFAPGVLAMRVRSLLLGLVLAATLLTTGCCWCRPWGHCHHCGSSRPGVEVTAGESDRPAMTLAGKEATALN